MPKREHKPKPSHAPLWQKMQQMSRQQPVRFHVPGHKGGTYFHTLGQDAFASVLQVDWTELDGLDDLHHAQGIIAEAQRLAAHCFQARRTFFLIGGSSVGNLAMIQAILTRGDTVIVDRNCHRSVFHGLALANAQAVFCMPCICPDFGVAIGTDPSDLHHAMEQYPQAKAIIVTRPNYYGMSIDLREVICEAHRRGMVVLIDEAHGAHFGQHDSLPRAAMQLGADLSVQSTHKMASSMTMTSMLHMHGNRVDEADVAQFVSMLQSSSPSYPLLASLDLARDLLDQTTDDEWAEQIEHCAALRDAINRLGSYRCSPIGKRKMDRVALEYDPFKVIIQPQNGASGYELQDFLRQQHIYVELADPRNVLLTLPLQRVEQWQVQLIESLRAFQTNGVRGNVSQKGNGQAYEPGCPATFRADRDGTSPSTFTKRMMHVWSTHTKRVCPPLPMGTYRQRERMVRPLADAVGYRAADLLTPYPPGVPLLVPGETITSAHVDAFLYLTNKGAVCHGIIDVDEATFPVIQAGSCIS